MINANSDFIRSNYKYCSDSFSTWRYKSFEEILHDTNINSLHVLLHPEWWTEQKLSTRDKILSCIRGRSDNNQKYILNIYKEWIKNEN